MSIICGEKAGAFRDLLFSLPASLGNRKSSLTLEEEAQKAREEGLPTLSGKKCEKLHDEAVSPVEPAPLARTGQPQPVDRLEFRERIENSQEKLDDKGTGFAGFCVMAQPVRARRDFPTCNVTLIAAYSGMRLGEIYTLRKEDLQTVDGTSCFLVRPHTETGWASKTEAGTRMMQVHSKLIEAGLLALKETSPRCPPKNKV